MTDRSLLLLALNELNFDVAKEYVDRLGLRNFGQLFATGVLRTASESRYELLEPWIQWVSAHSGLTAAEHGIFRLGDIVSSRVPQVFEQLEAAGYRVGAVSPMNAENRLHAPAYFIPDPWTNTPTDGTPLSRGLWTAISQAVNDNASGRITLKSALTLAAGLLRFAQPRHYGLYWLLARRSRGAPWRKALLLDLFLHDLHFRLYAKHRPNFSTLFLNAGAHIQHHYFFNSPAAHGGDQKNPAWYVAAHEDPIAEMLEVYDAILGDYLALPKTSLITATGLTQTPYDRVKFYYRLKDHEGFLRRLGVQFQRVLPRMTRDFVIEFDHAHDADAAAIVLGRLRVTSDGQELFGEIDNRGSSLFVTLTYANEITPELEIQGAVEPLNLSQHVVFVAIKNGMHDSRGYACFTGKVADHAPADGSHIKWLHSAVLAFFQVTPPRPG